ncbi:DUF2461 domain-containing protein [Adhaeretor mobilis]|uniref:TIGR02453 family protein n=1 Tax=Adhaeretor mobilis TaxID=1930276 RepID=A0A517MZW8_9BACT|nr:TIGR02453 family protein [Adhaeretor mobilis]QDT00432.1 hypothetical protein HG15A2_37700 [Adhaeretor mobilis]
MAKTKFPGFPLDLLKFFDQLSKNNNRDWFAKHKPRYEESVLVPAMAFVEAMAAPLAKISPHFIAVPKRQGGSIMRIYRDVRFGKDKRPYKTNLGIHFRHEKGKDVHAPGFYSHIDNDEAFLGAGIWNPDGPTLRKIRRAIDKQSAEWRKTKSSAALKKRWELSGESLKRPPQGYTVEHPLIEDIKRKDHIAVAKLDYDTVLSADVVKETATAFRASRGYVAFLCEAIGLKF